MAGNLDRSHGRCGSRRPVVVYAHDENLVERKDPAEKLHQEIRALDEENRKLLDSISHLKGEKNYSFGEWPSAKGARPCAVRKPVVVSASCAAPVGTRCLAQAQVLRPPQTIVATPCARFHHVVASNPSNFNPTAPRSFPSSPVVSRAASPCSVRLQSSQQQQQLPRSPSPPQAVFPVSTTASAPGSVLSEPIAAQSDGPAATTARRTAALQQTPGQTTGFAEVYNKFLQAAIESTEVGAAVAALERERDKAVADAERLRASNARLEQAVAASYWGSRELPVYAPAGAACAQSPATSWRTGLPQSPQLSPRPAAPRSPAAAQRGSYPARPPSEESSACFKKGWRYFHEQQQLQDKSKESPVATAIKRASEAMLNTEPGRDSSVGSIWREALLEGALSARHQLHRARQVPSKFRASLPSEASPQGASGTESDPATPS